MPDRSRITKTPELFDLYIKRVVNMLLATVGSTPVTNWQNLGLTSDEMDKIKEFLTKWWSNDPGNPGVYELFTNQYTLSKVIIASRQNVLQLIDEFSEFFSPLLTRMEGSPNITSNIRLILNIAKPHPHHIKHESEITASCYTKVITKQGGIVQFKCSSESDSGRASMLEGEGEVEIEALLSILPSTIDDTGKVIPPLAPTGENDPTLTMNETSTKAAFYLKTLPAGSATKTLQGYTRWRDVHNMERTGPLTPIPPTIIN